jgi:cell division control protein 6
MSSVEYRPTYDVELTKEKIEQMIRKIHRQDSVFSDKRHLDPLFLSSKIIGRKKQAEQLLRYFESRTHGLIVPIVSVYGRSGSGKSTVVRFVCNNLGSTTSHAFVNLRKAKTVFGCANMILSELGLPNLKNADGLSNAINTIEKRII